MYSIGCDGYVPMSIEVDDISKTIKTRSALQIDGVGCLYKVTVINKNSGVLISQTEIFIRDVELADDENSGKKFVDALRIVDLSSLPIAFGTNAEMATLGSSFCCGGGGDGSTSGNPSDSTDAKDGQGFGDDCPNIYGHRWINAANTANSPAGNGNPPPNAGNGNPPPGETE